MACTHALLHSGPKVAPIIARPIFVTTVLAATVSGQDLMTESA